MPALPGRHSGRQGLTTPFASPPPSEMGAGRLGEGIRRGGEPGPRPGEDAGELKRTAVGSSALEKGTDGRLGPRSLPFSRWVLVLKGQGLGVQPRRMPRLAAPSPVRGGGRRGGRRGVPQPAPSRADPAWPDYHTFRNDRIPRQNARHPPPATHSSVETRPRSLRAWGERKPGIPTPTETISSR